MLGWVEGFSLEEWWSLGSRGRGSVSSRSAAVGGLTLLKTWIGRDINRKVIKQKFGLTGHIDRKSICLYSTVKNENINLYEVGRN